MPKRISLSAYKKNKAASVVAPSTERRLGFGETATAREVSGRLLLTTTYDTTSINTINTVNTCCADCSLSVAVRTSRSSHICHVAPGSRFMQWSRHQVCCIIINTPVLPHKYVTSQ